MTSGLEALAFAIGIKPALRISLGRIDAAREVGRWRSRGAVVLEGAGLIYVARDPARAAALRDAEAAVLPRGPRRTPDAGVFFAHREVGRLLGYPHCCVEAYLERLGRGVETRLDGSVAAELVVAAERAWTHASCRYARLNFLLPHRQALVPFDPCAFDCEVSCGYANSLMSAHRMRDPVAAAALEAALLRDVSLGREGPLRRGADDAEMLLMMNWDAF